MYVGQVFIELTSQPVYSSASFPIWGSAAGLGVAYDMAHDEHLWQVIIYKYLNAYESYGLGTFHLLWYLTCKCDLDRRGTGLNLARDTLSHGGHLWKVFENLSQRTKLWPDKKIRQNGRTHRHQTAIVVTMWRFCICFFKISFCAMRLTYQTSCVIWHLLWSPITPKCLIFWWFYF